jgi:hypothetical protein
MRWPASNGISAGGVGPPCGVREAGEPVFQSREAQAFAFIDDENKFVS